MPRRSQPFAHLKAPRSQVIFFLFLSNFSYHFIIPISLSLILSGGSGSREPQRCVVLSVLQTKLPQVPCCLQSLQVYQSKSSRCLWAGRMPGSRERSCVREREDSSAWVLDLLTFHLGKQETMMLLTWSDSCCCCMKIEMLPSA